jgi:ABC-2 type transport system permease protein
MARLVLVRKTLRDVRAMAFGGGATVFAMTLIHVLVYPSYEKSLKDFKIPDAMKGFLGEAESIATPEGFTATEVFSWLPLLIITFAIIAGTGVTAGEEGAGTLDLLLAQPVRRRRLLVEKAVAVALGMGFAWAMALPGLLMGKLFVDFDLGVGVFAEALLMSYSMILVYIALALWMGTVLPNRGAAAMVCIGAVVVPYFVYTIGSAVSDLAFLKKLTPFYWVDASHVFISGFDWLRFGAMMAIAAVFFALSLWSFGRRDIAVGAREWSMRSAIAARFPAWRRTLPEPSDAAAPHRG